MAAQAIRFAGLHFKSARFASLASNLSRRSSPLLSHSLFGAPVYPGLTSTPLQHPGWRHVPRCSLLSHAKSKSAMPVRLGEVIPDLEVTTTKGKYKLQEWLGDGWGAIFSFPAAFTPVCTTELAVAAKYQPKFKERDVKLMGVTIESPDNQDFGTWLKDVETFAETKIEFPIAFDPSRALSDKLNLLDLENLNGEGNPMNARGIHIIRPDKKIRLTLLYPGPVGRNFDEIIRCIAALQLNWKLHVATPANWKIGDRVIVPPKISDEEAEKRGIKNIKAEDLASKKKYLRWGEAEVLTKI